MIKWIINIYQNWKYNKFLEEVSNQDGSYKEREPLRWATYEEATDGMSQKEIDEAEALYKLLKKSRGL